MTKTINLSLPEELLKKIDIAAKGEYASRSDFIRETIVRRLKGQLIIDEWGDAAGQWETVADFREISPNGIPAEDVLQAINTLTNK